MDSLLTLVIGGMMLIAITFGIYCVDSSVNDWKCESSARVMKMDHQWSFATGCMVKAGGQWVPSSSFRTIGGVE